MFSNPIEVLKTRMQLQGELQKSGTYVRPYRNMFTALVVVAKNEGVRGVQKGLFTAFAYQFVMNGTRLGSYDLVRNAHSKATSRPMAYFETVLLGAGSGTFAGFIASPFQLVKTHLQAQCHHTAVVGYQHHHHGGWHALKGIYIHSGITGLWRGATGSIARLGVGSAVQLSTYSQCKAFAQEKFKSDGIAVHIASSMAAGFLVSCAMAPFDTISVRLYNQPAVGSPFQKPYYAGWFDCVYKTYRAEGFTGFYKGFWPVYFRIGPHTILTFLFWEELIKLEEKFNR